MASLDKTSVRSQVEKVRKDFEQLRSDGKVSPEVQAIMSSMLMIVELILAIFWSEPPRRIALTPAFLPRKTDKDNSSLTDPGSKGKGKKADGETVKNRRTIETLTIVPVDYCDKCGADLEAGWLHP
ncbi:MAG: hypothetical protein WJ306_05065 [Ferrovum myxofaciens]